MLSLGCSHICFASSSQVISWKDWFVAPIKLLAGKIISKMTYSVSSGGERQRMLNPIVPTYLPTTPLNLTGEDHLVDFVKGGWLPFQKVCSDSALFL